MCEVLDGIVELPISSIITWRVLLVLTSSPGSVVAKCNSPKVIFIMLAVWVLGTAAFPAGGHDNVTVRHIGRLDSVITLRILRQVHIVSIDSQHDSPILLQGRTISRLKHKHQRELKA